MTETTNNLQIQVDDGTRRISITNTLGQEIGVFFFRPTDVGIINRFNQMVDELDHVFEPLINADVAPDGSGADEMSIEILNTAAEKLYAAVDKMFDGNMSEAFFGSMHPFAVVDGSFYCERVLNQVGSFIAAQFDEEAKKISKRIAKYAPRDHKRAAK